MTRDSEFWRGGAIPPGGTYIRLPVRSLVVLFALGACVRHSPAESERTKPRLVVLIVIDQWPSWMFEREQKLYTGGLARLLREGAVVPAADLPYANSFTAVGHATLGTGAPPRESGIVGNNWWRRDEQRERAAEYDPNAQPFLVNSALGSEMLSQEDGSSSRALRVEGVADVLRRATQGRAHSVAIALKARAACFVAGKRPDIAIWYESSAGGMTTSKAYAKDTPPWLIEHAHEAPVSRYFDAVWQPRDAALLARVTGMPDDAPGEQSDHGLGATFPHAIAASKSPARAIIETPFADDMIAHTAIVAIDRLALGNDDVPDFLAISFNAHDYAGHNWGPDSWEVLDLTLRLDVTLGKLFDVLDKRLGKGGWAVIVTSDHGATPIVERTRVSGARRIPLPEIERVAEQAIETQLGQKGPWVARLVSGNIYLTPKFQAVSARDAALDAAVKALSQIPNIAIVGRTDRFSAGCEDERDVMRAICLGTVPGQAGELFIYPIAGSLISDSKGGTAHDAPFDDNRRVPILVKAPGLAPQRGTGSVLQVAPTLAALLGVPPPPAAKAPTLFEIQRR